MGWCAPQQGTCKLSLNIKNGVIEEALVETIGCSGMTHSAAMAGEILPGKTILEALNTDLVCDAINVAMRELFLQIVYGRSQTAFSEDGLPIGAGLDDLGKGLRSMTGTIFSNPTDEIYVIDRAGEYTAIAERYGGTTYHFGVGTNTFLNPFDTVSVEHMPRTEQIAFKIDAMLAQAGASAAESGQSLSEVDQSIIQRCVELAFQRAEERGDGLPPTLQDFYDIALEQPEHQAQTIALRYERFVKGSMDFFNRQSNVDFNTRIVDFNLKDLPDSMLVFALINVCEAVRNRMYFNAKRNVRTWLYVEEMQSLFAYPTVLNYFSRFSNEGRKFGLLLTGITQNAVAMLNNEAAQNIVLNADFIMLLKQSPLDRMRWVELLNLSEQEEECIDESAEAGDGLLIAGNARVPIRGKFPSGNVLYDLFSTNPNETKELENRLQEEGRQSYLSRERTVNVNEAF